MTEHKDEKSEVALPDNIEDFGAAGQTGGDQWKSLLTEGCLHAVRPW